MTTLYIDRKNTELKSETGVLVQYINGERQRTLPLNLLDHIVISSNVQMQSNVLLRLAEKNIDISIINPRNSRQQLLFASGQSKNIQRRIQQYQIQQTPRLRQQIAAQIVQAKILKHIRFYHKIQQQRPDLRYASFKVLQQLNRAYKNITTNNPELDTLRGIEGNAAKAVFACYQHLFADSLNFKGRNRRPPKDPVNACLSLAFTLTHHRAIQQLHASGLDPMLGYLHEAKYSRDSLASDVIEVWRPTLEAWVWQLFHNNYLKAEHFSKQNSQNNSACLLNKAGRQRFYAAFEKQIKPIQRAMRWQIMNMIKRYDKQ